MTIVLNGEAFETVEQVTVGRLLDTLHIDPRRVAVEHNLVVVKKSAYDLTVISDGDAIEVVNFVAGG